MRKQIFYNTKDLNFETKKRILEEAKKVCYEFQVDELISNNLQRKESKKTYNEMLKDFKIKDHFVVIKRTYPLEHGEIGYCTIGENPEYFLFLFLTEEDLNNLVNKFHLN